MSEENMFPSQSNSNLDKDNNNKNIVTEAINKIMNKNNKNNNKKVGKCKIDLNSTFEKYGSLGFNNNMD